MPTTRWTVVLQTGDCSSSESQAALEKLCRAHWYPLYAFVRHKGRSPEDAQDLIQGFFAHLLGKGGLGTVQRRRGRFRSFLLASLEHFLADEWDKATAQKRDPGQPLISIDERDTEGRYLAEPVDELDPAALFEWRWAMDLLNEVHVALAQDCAARGKSRRFETLRQFLQEGRGTMTYAEAGVRLGLSEGAVTQEVFVMRRRFGELLHARIRDTVESEAEVEEEIAHLIQVVSRGGKSPH